MAVRIVGLGKRYRIGGQQEKYKTLRDTIVAGLKQPIARVRHPGAVSHRTETLWALRGIDLEVGEGDVVGIVGRNGAGKSTLLKVLSRITDPTEGRVEVRGRVGSLLEVGTGFHQELTGRENIYLNGAILGMSRADISRKFDEIVAFSEIERFLETPVKRYSSGMYVRLAFAVAAHLEPEILVVDEVLSVGDLSFQRKCLGKMESVAGEGRTVLFVSHNMQAVLGLCSRGVEIEAGRVKFEGSAADTVEHYIAGQSAAPALFQSDGSPLGSEEDVQLLSVRVASASGSTEGPFRSSEPLDVLMDVDVHRLDEALCIGFDLVSNFGTVLRSYHTTGPAHAWPQLALGRNRLRCRIPARLLNDGRFMVVPRVSLHCIRWVVNSDAGSDAHGAVAFDVVRDHSESPYGWVRQPGAIALDLAWEAAPLATRESAV